jgi:hypothetical protein
MFNHPSARGSFNLKHTFHIETPRNPESRLAVDLPAIRFSLLGLLLGSGGVPSGVASSYPAAVLQERRQTSPVGQSLPRPLLPACVLTRFWHGNCYKPLIWSVDKTAISMDPEARRLLSNGYGAEMLVTRCVARSSALLTKVRFDKVFEGGGFSQTSFDNVIAT